MTLTELLTKLQASGIDLAVKDDRLVCKAPKGALTPELAEAVRAHKPALIDLISHRAATADSAESPIEPIPPGGRRPLTTAQESLVFRQLLEPGSAFLNLPGAWHLCGPLDVDRLKVAIAAFYERHDIVRATIESDAEGIRFVIGEAGSLEIPLIDLQDIDADLRHDHLVRYLESRSKDHVDLENGPLFQCELINFDADHHILFILVNHLVWDGWSFDIFLGELDKMYAASGQGEPSGVAPLPVQYSDYAQWHREWIESDANRERLRTVARGLGDYSGHFEVPADKARPANFSFDGSSVYFELPRNLSEAIDRLCGRFRVTPFMLLVSVFELVLYRFSGQDDIAIGSHIQNRTRAELDPLVGFFVNTMVIRNRIDADARFPELLDAVRNRCLTAYDNRHVPVDSLVRELRVPPDPANLPLVQVFFSYQDTSDRTRSIGDVTCRSVIRTAQTADADLTLWVRNFGDRLDGGFDYRTDLYEPETIKSVRSAFIHVLEEVAADPDVAIADIRYLSAEDRDRQFLDWGRADEPVPDLTVDRLLARQIERTPDNVAISCGDERMTYRELDARVQAGAVRLHAAGVRRGQVVGVHMERSVELVATLLSVLRAGAAYLPLDPRLPDERLRLISEDAGLALLVTDAAGLPGWLPAGSEVLNSAALRETGRARSEPDAATPADPAYVIYTSGSTGKPKGVVVRHENVVNFLTAMAQEPGMAETDRLLAVTTYSFDISVLELFLPLSVGAEVVVATNDETRDGNVLAALLDERKITVLQSTPATWRLLLASDWNPGPGLKALCGGEALPVELAKALRPHVGSLFNMYGPTEATVWSSVHRFESGLWDSVPLGRPVLNTQMYVLDRRKNPLPRGAIGELYIGGRGVASGYHKRAAMTRERFLELPFRPEQKVYATGDLVRIGGSGDLYFEGRIDDQVKVRGFRIELGDIENALQHSAMVAEAAVVAKRFKLDDHRLIAYVVPATGESLSVGRLRKELRKLLPDYMLPHHITGIERMPLTPSGKIDRKALPDVELSSRRNRTEPPASEVERRLADIWKKAIGVDHIDRRDHFFELGGHSLLAMHVIAEIEATMGKRVPAASLMLDSLQQIAASFDAGGEPPRMTPPVAAARPRKGMLKSIKGWMTQ